MVTVREWLERLRGEGFGLYEAMEELDIAAGKDGYNGGQFYHILGEVYADWEEPPKRKRRYVKSEHTKKEWEALKERYSHRCFYCGRRRILTKDHVIPITRGGDDKIDNVVPSCWPCNHKKRAMPVEESKNGAMLKLI